MADDRPIGIFDSGLGGLTVLREFVKVLPGEDLIYFGDTGRVPYGSRSPETITQYARQDEHFLLSQGVKMIIAACGTVSSVASHTGAALPVPFIEVVSPAAEAAVVGTRTGRIGVIGTSATIHSGAYEARILSLRPDAQVFSIDCPLFVPLVEAGWITPGDSVTAETVRRYLSPLKEKDIDTLILGCTHYPVLAPFIAEFMGPQVTLINTGLTAANTAADFMETYGLRSGREQGSETFYVSDRPKSFADVAKILLGQDIGDRVTTVEITKY